MTFDKSRTDIAKYMVCTIIVKVLSMMQLRKKVSALEAFRNNIS